MIGPLPNYKTGRVGGAAISFSYLWDYFRRHKLSHYVLDTRPFDRDRRRYFHVPILFYRTLRCLPTTDVVFVNMSMGGTRYIAPILFIIAKAFGRKFVFRPFGSRMKEEYEQYGTIQKWIFHRTLLRSELLLLQTEALCDYFRPLTNNVRQLPTSRDAAEPTYKKVNPTYQKRFIYLGRILPSKGIDYLLAAKKQLGADYTIHLYGAIEDEKYNYLKEEDSIYKGVLGRDAVTPVLAQYDVLILPTFFEGEGYPGAIIEAYSLGIPVIATQWKSIPEIVEHEQTGLLIPPKSVTAIIEAIQYFNQDNYPTFSKKAEQTFDERFSAKMVLKQMMTQFLDILTEEK